MAELRSSSKQIGSRPARRRLARKPRVADAYEATREQVQQKASQELVDRQGHQLLLVAMRRVTPAEYNVAVLERNQSVVGDGHSMGVGAKIAQRVFWASEGSLDVDHPVVAEEGSQPCREVTRHSEVQQAAVELERSVLECCLKPGNELAAEDTAEHLDGQKERPARADPTSMIRS